MARTQCNHRFTSWSQTFVLLWMLVVVSSVTSDAAEKQPAPPLEKVTIAYSSISGTMASMWVTYEAGFFRKYGLDVELVHFEGGTTAVKALVSGQVEFAQVGGTAVLRSNLKGSDAVMIAGFLNTMNYQFIVEKNIRRPEQLKGMAVAVSRFGGSSDFATRYAIEKFGLVPQKDVAILEIGSQPVRLAALKEGEVQGVMLAVPHTTEARKLGFSSLAELQTLGLEFQHTGLATTRALIKSRPELVRKVMRAYAEGIHYYKTHRREGLAILSKYLGSDDPEALAETYEILGLTLLPEKPYPTLRGIQVILRRLAKKDPKTKGAQPVRFVDMSFARELDSSGFIDTLYNTTPTVVAREERRPTSTPAIVKKQEKPAPAMAKPDPQSPSMSGQGEAEAAVAVVRPVPQSLSMSGQEKMEAAVAAVSSALQSSGIWEQEKLEAAVAAVRSALQSSGISEQESVKTAVAVAKRVPVSRSLPNVVREYTVKAGDTLSHLAYRSYRDASYPKWMKIYEANRQAIKSPDRLYIGQKIIVPAD